MAVGQSARENDPRIVVVGAVESTHTAVEAMQEAGFPPRAIITLTAELQHRHSDFVDLRPHATQHGIPIIETSNINQPETLGAIAGHEPDYVFVVGWSQICLPPFLELPRLGVIGFHPAALPENRGRAVIPWTILQGATETGATLFWMDEGLDSGDILAQHTFDVDPAEAADSLYTKHMDALRAMLDEVLPDLRNGTGQRIPQDHNRATFCARRTPDDGAIDWNLPAVEVWRLIRATGRPYPGAFTTADGHRLVIWRASLDDSDHYWGLPGQVQTFIGDAALIQCGDRQHILASEIQVDSKSPVAPSKALKRHQRLGR